MLGLANEYPHNLCVDMLYRHEARLEAQRTRLMDMLDKEKDPDRKLSIERLLLEVDTKLMNVPFNAVSHEIRTDGWLTDRINKFLKKKHINERYVSPNELWTLSKDKYDRVVKIINEKE